MTEQQDHELKQLFDPYTPVPHIHDIRIGTGILVKQVIQLFENSELFLRKYYPIALPTLVLRKLTHTQTYAKQALPVRFVSISKGKQAEPVGDGRSG